MCSPRVRPGVAGPSGRRPGHDRPGVSLGSWLSDPRPAAPWWPPGCPQLTLSLWASSHPDSGCLHGLPCLCAHACESMGSRAHISIRAHTHTFMNAQCSHIHVHMCTCTKEILNSVKIYIFWNPHGTEHKKYFSAFCLCRKNEGQMFQCRKMS